MKYLDPSGLFYYDGSAQQQSSSSASSGNSSSGNNSTPTPNISGQPQSPTPQVPDTSAMPGMLGEKLIMIDPGYGGDQEGSKGAGLIEKNINLTVSYMVLSKLEEAGIKSELTRKYDKTTSLQDRYTDANSKDADIFVSIHTNSTNPLKKGFSIIIPNNNATRGIQSGWLGICIGKELKQTENIHEGPDSIYQDNRGLAVLNGTQMPAVLIEIGYIVGDSKNLKNQVYLDSIATGISSGIINYLSGEKK